MRFSRWAFVIAALGALVPASALAITIDATALTAPTFSVFYPPIGPLSTAVAQSLPLGPGTYVLVDEVNGSFTFEVDGSGLVSYDPANENFLDGAGTTTLTVRGLDVTFDATALTTPTYWVPHLFTYTSRSIVKNATMLPGGPVGFADEASNEVGFWLDAAGNFYYPADAEDYFDGAGTPNLIVTGHHFTVDLTALTTPLFTMSHILSGPVSTTSVVDITGIQGIGYEVRDGLSNFVPFSLDPDGRVHYQPQFEGFVDGEGTTELVVRGYTMTIDVRGLPFPTISVPGYLPTASTSTVHTWVGIPSYGPGYLFICAGIPIFFEMDLDGHYQGLPSTFLGFPVTGNGTNALVIGTPPVGSVAGKVTADCPAVGSPLLGVRVDVFEDGSGDLAGSAVTDASGQYLIEDLAAGSYTASIVTPLGFLAASPELALSVSGGAQTTADFALNCLAVTGSPRGSGYWKHQVAVATGGSGQAQVDAATLCSYLDLIAAHFNDNAINPVAVYEPPASNTCTDKLQVARQLLNLVGSAAAIDRAKQQLTALLLNVAAGFVVQTQTVSADGATASQAITYCDNLIDEPTGDHDLARTIATMINGGQQVPAGMIPLGTPVIAYGLSPEVPTEGRDDQLDETTLELRIAPNPASGIRTFSFAVGKAGSASLGIYDVSGRQVADLYRGPIDAGWHSFTWDGRPGGQALRQGLYFARLSMGGRTRVVRVVQTAH